MKKISNANANLVFLHKEISVLQCEMLNFVLDGIEQNTVIIDFGRVPFQC